MTKINELNYSFSDDHVQAFFYNIFGKTIELYFERYYDKSIGELKNVYCKFVIEGWTEAYSIPYEAGKKNEKRYSLDDHMAVFFMIMDMKYESGIFEITINTIDERYVTYIFEHPTLNLVEVPPLLVRVSN